MGSPCSYPWRPRRRDRDGDSLGETQHIRERAARAADRNAGSGRHHDDDWGVSESIHYAAWLRPTSGRIRRGVVLLPV